MRPDAAALALLVSIVGCTDAGLRKTPEPPPTPVDDKLAIQGRVCTSDPSTLEFPVKIILVIDSSQSMIVSDPADPVTLHTGRREAAEAVVNELLTEDKEGVGIAIITFAGASVILTQCDYLTEFPVGSGLMEQCETVLPGDPDDPLIPNCDGILDTDCFSNNRAELLLSTPQLDNAGGLTAYFSAIGEAFSLLSADVQNADEIALARSKYVVVFLSDGLPDSDLAEERENILGAVEDMVELAQAARVGEFSFNTAFLSTAATPEIERAAESLLQAMAEIGNGTYRSFPNGEAINFLDVDLTSLRRAFTLSSIIATNSNTLLRDTGILIDSDTDAIADIDEDLDQDGRVDLDEDTDGNGILGEDADEDGRLDVFEDENGNGILDVGEDPDCDGLLQPENDLDRDGVLIPTEDRDCDGILDVQEDQNGNGVLDGVCEDANGNGALDQGEDGNGNGALDLGEDVDCDGHLDVDETDPTIVDTDGYGFSDGLEVDLCPNWRTDTECGFTPVDPPELPPPPAEPQPEDCVLDVDKRDVDGDGIRDCEERFYGTNRLSYDSDRDGLPDQVEIRFGTNPSDDDAEDDADFDQTTNGQEVRTFGDPRNNDASIRAERGYRYRVLSDGLDGSRTCREFRVENITLVQTLDQGWNLIYVYAGQVPFDDPGSAVEYRVACAWARFDETLNIKDPPGGFLELEESDFYPPVCPADDAECHVLDTTTDCVGPRSL